MTRKEAAAELRVTANYVARRNPRAAAALRLVATMCEHEDDLVEKAMNLSDHIVFDARGKATIKDDEAFAEYFFAFVAVFADRRASEPGV